MPAIVTRPESCRIASKRPVSTVSVSAEAAEGTSPTARKTTHTLLMMIAILFMETPYAVRLLLGPYFSWSRKLIQDQRNKVHKNMHAHFSNSLTLMATPLSPSLYPSRL